MGGPQRRKKMHKGGHAIRRLDKTKRRDKDIDQIDDELKKPKSLPFKKALDEDLPGQGRFYCFTCSKHFVNQESLNRHKTQKPHKRRLKELELEPYSQKEAERAAGMGSYVAPKSRNVTELVKKAEEECAN